MFNPFRHILRRPPAPAPLPSDESWEAFTAAVEAAIVEYEAAHPDRVVTGLEVERHHSDGSPRVDTAHILSRCVVA